MSFRDFSQYARPRRVEGGLRATSTKGAIGTSWWSRRFLDVLESFALGTRLTRGRAYARAGQVLSLDIAPGMVTAAVQGSRTRPYRVRIGLSAFQPRLWERIETILAEQALFSARLLAGELPAELEEVFVEAGAPLFPSDIGELDQRCSCPDVAVPCKHLAATFYLLAEAFDADPFQLLHWRGRSRGELLDQLRRQRAKAYGELSQTEQPSPVFLAESTVGTAAVLADVPFVGLAEAVQRFWLSPIPLPQRRPPVLTADPELLLRQLGPPGSGIGGPGLVERLRPAYRRFGAGRPQGPANCGD